jgi:hypothetical protein
VPRRTLRLRVGGLVLAVGADHPTRALDPPASVRPFLTSRGADIHLRLAEEPAPTAEGTERLFDSGGVWRVAHAPGRLLYTFRTPKLRPSVYKAVEIDEELHEGRLYFPKIPDGPAYALDYPLDELLFQHRLSREGALEVHACGVVWRGRVLLFCGRSRAGKSTTARLWRRHAPEARLLSDDRIVLRPSGGGFRAWGTPWHGDGGFAAPESRPLGAVFFLRRGPTRARTLTPAEAAARLFARGFPPPWDPAGMARALDLCAAVATAVPSFELIFRPDRSAVVAAQAAVRPRA